MIGVYSPRIDVAVGPFATGNKKYGKECDRLLKLPTTQTFVKALVEKDKENCTGRELPIAELSDFESANKNARCFLAIEIENQVSRKHLIGGIINASA